VAVIHRVDLVRSADPAQKGDAEFAAEVFAEFLEAAQEFGGGFDPIEKRGVADDGHFDRLDQPGAEVAGIEGREQVEIVDDRPGRGECSHQVFFPAKLIPFFTPTPASACARSVPGNRRCGMPRCSVAAANPATSRNAPPPMAATHEWRHSFSDSMAR
jgi:hypothetical protein